MAFFALGFVAENVEVEDWIGKQVKMDVKLRSGHHWFLFLSNCRNRLKNWRYPLKDERIERIDWRNFDWIQSLRLEGNLNQLETLRNSYGGMGRSIFSFNV